MAPHPRRDELFTQTASQTSPEPATRTDPDVPDRLISDPVSRTFTDSGVEPEGDHPQKVERGTFAAGQVIGQRFAVRGFCGRGGMGEVYAVQDLVTGERKALKTVRPEFLRSDAARQRLIGEVRSACRVTHRHVCRIFDVGFHESAGVKVPFLSMELVDGSTLAERLRRGPMPIAEARSIARQIADGLGAIHGAGLVHRDLKPSNVILEPGASGGVRAVITDFGIAHEEPAAMDLGHDDVRGATGLAGTPAYMAPEQLQHHRATARTDIYAFGEILYEMISGTKAFGGELGSVIDRKNRGVMPSPPPANDALGLSSRAVEQWNAVIQRCLAPEPARRFESAHAVVAALAPEAPARRLWPWLVSLFAIVLATAIGWSRRGPPEPRAAPPSPDDCIAIMGFENQTGRADLDWVSALLSVMVETEMPERVCLLPSGDTAEMKEILNLSAKPHFTRTPLDRMGTQFGLRRIVVGAFRMQPDGETLRFTAEWQEVASGELAPLLETDSRPAALRELAARIGSKVRDSFRLENDPVAGSAIRSYPSDAEALRLLGMAMERMRIGDLHGARKLLEEARTRSPNQPRILILLHSIYDVIGEGDRMKETLAALKRSMAALSPFEQLFVANISREKPAVDLVKRAQELCRRYPMRTGQCTDLAHMLALRGQADEARSLLAETHSRPMTLAAEIGATKTTKALNDFAGCREHARHQRELAETMGAVSARADGLWHEAYCSYRLGLFGEALEKAEEMDNLAMPASRLNNHNAKEVIFFVEQERGELAAAERTLGELPAVGKPSGDRGGRGWLLHHKGWLLIRQGRLAEAEGALREARALHAEWGMKVSPQVVDAALARVLQKKGLLADAKSLFLQSQDVVVNRPGADLWPSMLHRNMAEMLLAEDDVAGARERLQVALDIPSKHKLPMLEARRRLDRAFFALDTGDLDGARADAEKALAMFKPAEVKDGWFAAQAILAAVEARTGNVTAGRRRLLAIDGTLPECEDMEVRLAVAILVARAFASAGAPFDLSEPERLLREAIMEADRIGFAGESLSARLALGEIELSAGRSAAGRAMLRAVATAAEKSGFKRIARRAVEAINDPARRGQ